MIGKRDFSEKYFYKALGDDYLLAAYNYAWAANNLYKAIPSEETPFNLIEPSYFSIGHAAELAMKAVLAYAGVSEEILRTEYGHGLEKLLSAIKSKKVKIDSMFESLVLSISENFKDHDYRYPRIFAGFPESRHEELARKVGLPQYKKELKKYGLAVKSLINFDQGIDAVFRQIDLINNLNKEEAA